MNNLNLRAAHTSMIIKQWYKSLTAREKFIIRAGLTGVVLVLGWLTIEKAFEYNKKLHDKIKASSELVPHVAQLAQRIHGLQSRRNELTTLYLNSTLSYEELTTYLDTLIKSRIGNNSYTLNKARDSETIGDEFTLQKFTIKINESDLNSIINLLHSLETGTPRMFIQRTDIVRNRTKNTLSLTLELASVQSVTSVP